MKLDTCVLEKMLAFVYIYIRRYLLLFPSNLNFLTCLIMLDTKWGVILSIWGLWHSTGLYCKFLYIYIPPPQIFSLSIAIRFIIYIGVSSADSKPVTEMQFYV